MAATVLAHAWLAPLGGAIVGMLFGLPIAMSVLGRQDGFEAITAVNWGEVITAATPLLLRAFAGTLPLLLWLAPLIFVLMAASAWLKRLGVPLVLVGTMVTVLVLDKVYAIEWPQHAIASWNKQINTSLLHNANGLKDALKGDLNLWNWAAHDFAQTMVELVSLEFAGWTLLAAAGFALVVMKRARGG